MFAALLQGLANLGGGATAKVKRLGFAARFFVAILLHSGTAFRRFGLTIREIYFAGVLSLVIIMMSGLFVNARAMATRCCSPPESSAGK